MEIWVSSKIRVLPYGTLCQNPDLENFAKEADRVVNKTRHRRRRSSLLTSPKQQSTSRGCLLYKSVNCSPLTPLLRFVVDLLYKMFLQILTDSATRGAPAYGSRASCYFKVTL